MRPAQFAASLRSRRSQVLGLLAWLAVVFAAAGLGAIASIEARSFYGELNRPSWSPPAAVFGPVWSALYALMGIAVWLVWRRSGDTQRALRLFVGQLAANALWSWLFFAWHHGALAFIDALLLLVLIAATIVSFWRLDRVAAVLLVPYIFWVGFASVLTWAVWHGNPGVL
jgi:tryptophan-rich sensory protein